MTTLVAIGCSHMAGSELDGKNGESIVNRKNCFAAIVAKQLGYNFYNLSVPGASNQFIHRKIVEFITTHKKETEDYLFLIGWTSSERMELRYFNDTDYEYISLADFHDPKYFPFTSGVDTNLIQDERMRKLQKFSDILFDNNLKYTEAATLVWSAQEIFKSNNLKYFMINSCDKLYRTPYNATILDKIDLTYFYNPEDRDSSYFYYCYNKLRFKSYSKQWHHYHPAHVAYSKFLIDKLKEVYKL